jgi:hypothetical protein
MDLGGDPAPTHFLCPSLQDPARSRQSHSVRDILAPWLGEGRPCLVLWMASGNSLTIEQAERMP